MFSINSFIFPINNNFNFGGLKMNKVLPTCVMLISTLLNFSNFATAENWPIINVKTDLHQKGIYKTNAKGDAKSDDTQAIQSAIDYVKANGGGYVYLPKGVYRVNSVKMYDTVILSGAGPDKTLLRSISSSYALIELHGGTIMNFTAYGAPTASVSGKHWKVGKQGKGIGGTAKPTSVIAVLDAQDAIIYNIKSLESRYDCLYIRTCKNLKVYKSYFDRAGRNIVSIVGNSDGFVFSDCYFGSLWGLYNFDIEHNKGNYIRNGIIENCVFDGSKAGQMGTDTWGSFLCFSGHEKLENRNIAVINCTFKKIYVRVRGVFPNVRFIGNKFDVSCPFIKIRTNPTGEFRDATVEGNKFFVDGRPVRKLTSGVIFTGKSKFQHNIPSRFNNIKIIPSEQKTAKWVEDHPAAVYSKIKKQLKTGTVITDKDVKVVSMPPYGYEFRFSDAKILKPSSIAGRDTSSQNSGDIAIHIEPIIALGNAKISKLGKGTIEAYLKSIDMKNIFWQNAIFKPQAGEVYAIRTKKGKIVLMEIITFKKKQVIFRYKYLTSKPK